MKNMMIVPKEVQQHMHLVHINSAESCDTLLQGLGEYAVLQGLADEGFPTALLEREHNYPTGIQASAGIAIPHSDQKYTLCPAIIVAILDSPVLFSPMGGGDPVPVETVFMLLMDKMEHQTDMLSAIVAFIQDENKLGALRNEHVSEELLQPLVCFFD